MYKEIACALAVEYMYATEIQHLLIDPHKDELYERLKQQLISRLVALEHQKLRQLLTAKELGTKSQPSCYANCDCFWVRRRK